MQQAVAVLCALITAQISNSRFVLRTARRVARIVRDIIVQEEWNALITAKSEMLRTPSWRARVLRDLGGAKALNNWDARFEKVTLPDGAPAHTTKYRAVQTCEAEPPKPTFRPAYALYTPHPLPPHPSQNAIFYDKFKTDQEGQFRLPPLARSRRNVGRHAARNANRNDVQTAGKVFRKPRAISVFPREFRTAAATSHAPLTNPRFGPNILPSWAGSASPLNAPPIASIRGRPPDTA